MALLIEIRDEFFKRLQSQTNWGKNQVEKLYLQVQSDVLAGKFTREEVTQEVKKPFVSPYNPKPETIPSPDYGYMNAQENEYDDPFADDEEIEKIKKNSF